MLIVCPSCSSRYNIDDAKIGVDGRKVRCASCGGQWHVMPPAASIPEPVVTLPAPEPQTTFAASTASTPEPEPEADPFDDAAMAREWANAEAWTDPTAETGGLTADKIRALDAGESLPDVAAGVEPEPDQAHAASAAALGAAAAVAAARKPWWHRLFRVFDLFRRKPKAAPVQPRTTEPLPAQEVPAKQAKASAAARVKKAPKARKPFKWPALPAAPFAAALAGFAILGGLYWQRELLVRLIPSTAPAFAIAGAPVNLTGLVFADIRSTVHAESGGRFLVVEGLIRSEARDTVNVPVIELNLRGADGRTVYTWTADPPRRALKPGESLHFRTRLATPPEAARDVEVRFSDKAKSAAARN